MIPFQLPLASRRVFAAWIEFSAPVTVQSFQDADARQHRQATVLGERFRRPLS